MYRKPIEVLLKLIEENPRDVRSIQKLGELYQKANRSKDAAQAFARVAELYAEDGFFLKAVALTKQVLKMDPGLVAARESLARYYEQLQLMTEAAAEYRALLEVYRFAGTASEVARILECLARLGVADPAEMKN